MSVEDEEEEGNEEEEDEDDEEDEELTLPREDDLNRLEDKLNELSVEFGLGAGEEEGDDESKEMGGIREIYSLVRSRSLCFLTEN